MDTFATQAITRKRAHLEQINYQGDWYYAQRISCEPIIAALAASQAQAEMCYSCARSLGWRARHSKCSSQNLVEATEQPIGAMEPDDLGGRQRGLCSYSPH